MKYLAILKDSLYETMDQKLLYVVMTVSVLLVLACASVTFPRRPVEEVLQWNVGPTLKVSDVRALSDQPHAATRYSFMLHAPAGPAGQPAAVSPRRATGFSPGSFTTPGELAKNPVAGLIPRLGFKEACVLEKTVDDQGKLERAAAEVTINWPEVFQGHKISFLFGVLEGDMPFPLGGVITGIQVTLVDYIAGVIGVCLAIIITAGFVPNMMRKGSIDLLLVKPISRPLLVLYKYLGGLTFVLINALVLVGASWFVFGLTLGNWNAWYLASIAVLLFYFAVLYSLSVLVGVLTQNQLAAILVTLGFYLAMIATNILYGWTHDGRAESMFPSSFVSAIGTVHFVLPRLGDLSALNLYALAEANGMPDAIREDRRQSALNFSWTETLVTSGAFIAVMLSLACWRFSRRDY